MNKIKIKLDKYKIYSY